MIFIMKIIIYELNLICYRVIINQTGLTILKVIKMLN